MTRYTQQIPVLNGLIALALGIDPTYVAIAYGTQNTVSSNLSAEHPEKYAKQSCENNNESCEDTKQSCEVSKQTYEQSNEVCEIPGQTEPISTNRLPSQSLIDAISSPSKPLVLMVCPTLLKEGSGDTDGDLAYGTPAPWIGSGHWIELGVHSYYVPGDDEVMTFALLAKVQEHLKGMSGTVNVGTTVRSSKPVILFPSEEAVSPSSVEITEDWRSLRDRYWALAQKDAATMALYTSQVLGMSYEKESLPWSS